MEQQQYEQLLAVFEEHASADKKARYLAFFRKHDALSAVAVPMLVKETESLIREIGLQELPVADDRIFDDVPPPKHTDGIVEYDDLPDDIKDMYDRLQVIIPQRAALHNDIQHCAKEEERKKMASQLCAIDDQRSQLWALITKYEEEKGVQLWYRKNKRNAKSEAVD